MRPDLDAIRKSVENGYKRYSDPFDRFARALVDVDALLTYVDELETEMQGLYKDIQWSRG